MDPEAQSSDSCLVQAVAFLAVPGALLAVVVAVLTRGFACGDQACDRQGLADFQLVIAVAGLVPVAFLVAAVVRGAWRRALLWLAVALVIYIAWGLFNDAATHGWANLKVF